MEKLITILSSAFISAIVGAFTVTSYVSYWAADIEHTVNNNMEANSAQDDAITKNRASIWNIRELANQNERDLEQGENNVGRVPVLEEQIKNLDRKIEELKEGQVTSFTEISQIKRDLQVALTRIENLKNILNEQAKTAKRVSLR